MSIRSIIPGAGNWLRGSRSATDRLWSGMRRARQYRGALVIVLWQAPVGPAANPDGSIGFMFGGGLDHLMEFNCAGDVIGAERARYRTVAVEADYDIGPGIRVDGTGGFMSGGPGRQDGAFAGAQFRYDGGGMGLGAGVVSNRASQETEDLGDYLSAYVRLGPGTGVHLRADVNPMHALMPQQFSRLGVGWNATQRDQFAGFVGLARVGGNAETTGVAGEFTFPVSRRGAFRVLGHLGSRDGLDVYGLVLGGRFMLQ